MNVILIIIDTLRPDHLGCYKDIYPQARGAHTPCLDRLARESMRFVRAHPESLPTLPARRAFHTGQRVWPFHQHQNYKGDFVGAPGWGPIPEGQDTLAELLKEAGYRTGFITDTYHQFKPSKNFHRGFQEWHWIRGQETDPYRAGPHVPDEVVLAHIAKAYRGNRNLLERHRQYLTNVAARRSEEDYFPARVFRAAADWLDRNRDAERFFLVVDSFDPHEPWDPPRCYRTIYDASEGDVADVIWANYGKSDVYAPAELSRMRANYAGEVSLVDRWLGHFLEAFRTTGRERDTLLILASDHGHYLGDHGLSGKMGYPMTREVADVVLLLRHPEGLQAGQTCGDLVSHVDVSATVLDAAGVRPKQPLHGHSLLPLVRRERGGFPSRDHLLVGWGPFVLVRSDHWWYNATLWGEEPLLFDLHADPRLDRNVAAQHPNIIAEMKRLALDECRNEYPDFLRQMADAALPGCTPLGKW